MILRGEWRPAEGRGVLIASGSVSNWRTAQALLYGGALARLPHILLLRLNRVLAAQ